MLNRPPDLFSYIVPKDCGFAPNPYGGVCTLACCKTPIRRYANVGDWVIGTTPAPDKEKLVYAMRVERGLTFDLYWEFPEYECKKPSKNNGCGDNIYKMGAGGELVQVKNLFHDEKHIKTDTSVNRVLISRNHPDEAYASKHAQSVMRCFGEFDKTIPLHYQLIVGDYERFIVTLNSNDMKERRSGNFTI